MRIYTGRGDFLDEGGPSHFNGIHEVDHDSSDLYSKGVKKRRKFDEKSFFKKKKSFFRLFTSRVAIEILETRVSRNRCFYCTTWWSKQMMRTRTTDSIYGVAQLLRVGAARRGVIWVPLRTGRPNEVPVGTGRHGPAKIVRAPPRSPLAGEVFVTLAGGRAWGVSACRSIFGDGAAAPPHRGLATGDGRKPASPGEADGAHANEARRPREVDECQSGIESRSVQGEIGSMARRTWNVIKGVWTEAGGRRSATGKGDAGSSAENAPGAVPGSARLSDRKRAAATIGRVLQLAQPEKKILALALASMLITTPMTLIMPAAVGQLLDVSVSADAVMSPLTVAGMLLGVFAVQGVFMSARDGLLAIAGERIAARLRTRTYGAILRQDMTFFDHSRTGELVNRLSSDVAVVQKALTSNVTSALRALGMALGGTGMMIHTCPKLAFVSLLVLPLGGALAVFIGRFLKRKQREVQDMLAATAQRAEECLTHMRLVRAFARERDEVHEYERLMLESREVSISIGIASALLGSVIHVAANVALAGVLGYGGTLVLSGEITVGRLTSFLLYSIYVGFNFGTLSTVYRSLMTVSVGLFYL